MEVEKDTGRSREVDRSRQNKEKRFSLLSSRIKGQRELYVVDYKTPKGKFVIMAYINIIGFEGREKEKVGVKM